jgi:hypothetical protein
MANKLFYTLDQSNASYFMAQDLSKTAIGIVNKGGDPFGYIVTFGQQISASYQDIVALSADQASIKANNALSDAKAYTTQALSYYATKEELNSVDVDVTVNANKNAFEVDGVKYTLSFDENNVLSVDKYIGVSLVSFTVTDSASLVNKISNIHVGSDTHKNSATLYVGTAYNIEVGATIKSDDALTFTANVKPGTNKFNVQFQDHNGKIMQNTEGIMANWTNQTTQEKFEITSYYGLSDYYSQINNSGNAYSNFSGTVAWVPTKTFSETLRDNTTTYFDKYAYCGVTDGTTNVNKKITIDNVTTTAKVSAKVLVAFDSNAYATVSGEQHVDVSYGSVSTISKTVNYDANDYVCVAVPTCAGFKSIECWDAGGQMKVDNYFAEVETTTREINGCTTEFKVYKSKGAAKGANSIIVKVIK